MAWSSTPDWKTTVNQGQDYIQPAKRWKGQVKWCHPNKVAGTPLKEAGFFNYPSFLVATQRQT